MCRWIAYMGTPIFLEELILAPRNSLIHQSLHCQEGMTPTNGDGFGIGWYGKRREPGIFCEVLPAWNDANLRSLCRQLEASIFFAHARASTGTATIRANCHPFAYQHWMFMHNGQIGGYDKLRRVLEARLDDAHYAARQGATDSELIFLLAHQKGLDTDPQQALAATIEEIAVLQRDAGIAAPLKLSACLSDGQQLIVCRHSGDGAAPSLYWYSNDTGVWVVSEPLDDERGHWLAVEPGTVMTITAQGMALAPLWPAAASAA